MAFVRIALFLSILYVAQCKPNTQVSDKVDLKPALFAKFSLQIENGNQDLVAVVQLNLEIDGEYNKTSHQQAVTDIVQNKLADIQDQSDDSFLEDSSHMKYSLPLQKSINVTLLLDVGPKPKTDLAIMLDIKVYAKKHHGHYLSLLKSFSPAL